MDFTLVISKAVAQLKPSFVWMGGGMRNLQCGVNLAELGEKFGSQVIAAADVTSALDDPLADLTVK